MRKLEAGDTMNEVGLEEIIVAKVLPHQTPCPDGTAKMAHLQVSMAVPKIAAT